MLRMDEGLTPRERAMLGGLTRHRVGSAALEDRVVNALVERGLLRRAVMTFGRASWRVVTQLAAAAAVFVVGVLVGRTSQAADVATESGALSATAVATGIAVTGLGIADTARRIGGTLRPVVQRVRGATMTAALGVGVFAPDTVDMLLRIARDVARITVRGAGLELASTRADTMIAMSRTTTFGVPEPVWR